MAKEKKEKRCKECEGQGKDCKCPPKMKKGSYGLAYIGDRHSDHHDNENPGTEENAGVSGEGGGLGEAIKMPKAPQDSDKRMQGISSEKKQKKMAEFQSAAAEAKKRQSDSDRKGELAQERRTKGIRFYDAKGSGYMKGGKKVYD